MILFLILPDPEHQECPHFMFPGDSLFEHFRVGHSVLALVWYTDLPTAGVSPGLSSSRCTCLEDISPEFPAHLLKHLCPFHLSQGQLFPAALGHAFTSCCVMVEHWLVLCPRFHHCSVFIKMMFEVIRVQSPAKDGTHFVSYLKCGVCGLLLRAPLLYGSPSGLLYLFLSQQVHLSLVTRYKLFSYLGLSLLQSSGCLVQ